MSVEILDKHYFDPTPHKNQTTSYGCIKVTEKSRNFQTSECDVLCTKLDSMRVVSARDDLAPIFRRLVDPGEALTIIITVHVASEGFYRTVRAKQLEISLVC